MVKSNGTTSTLYSLLKLTLGTVVRSVWLGTVAGVENLPKVGPAIIASNHASHLDFMLLSVVSPCQIQFMAGEVFYNNVLFNKAFDSMGHIRVNRGAKGTALALRKVIQRLKQGKTVVIFPEGTRSAKGVLQEAHNGVGFLAIETGVPVIPVFISGTFHAWPRHCKFPTPHRCTVRIGEPMQFNSPENKEQKKGHIHSATNEIMHAIARLGETEYP